MARKKKRAQKKTSAKAKPVQTNDSVDQNASQNSGYNDFSGGAVGFREVSSESESSSTSLSCSSGSGGSPHAPVGSDEFASSKGVQISGRKGTRLPRKGKMQKQVTAEKSMLTEVLNSSSLNRTQHQHPQCNKEELKASLDVIKKVMEMDEAASFRIPVDPVSLGIPDYFDVVDTPMDFGTICWNIQNGIKYLIAEDVYKDVQYIWNNCLKYNKKGDYIVYLMKRVRKKFMKYWTAAGLQSESLGEFSGIPHPLPSDHAMKFSQHDVISMVSHVVGSLFQMQENNSGVIQSQSQNPISSYNEPNPLHKPQPRVNQPCPSYKAQPSTKQPYRSHELHSISNQLLKSHKPQPSISQLHQSQIPQPSTNKPAQVPQLPVDTNSTYTGSQVHQDNFIDNHRQSVAPPPTYSQPCQSPQPQPSTSLPTQPSLSQADLESNSAAHSGLMHSNVWTMKRSKHNPIAKKNGTVGGQMHQLDLLTAQLQSQVPLSTNCPPHHLHQPEPNINQSPHFSQSNAATNDDFAEGSPINRTTKRKRYATRSSGISLMSSPTHPKQQQQSQLCPDDHLQQSQQSTCQPQVPHQDATEAIVCGLHAAHLQLLPSNSRGMRLNGHVTRSAVGPSGVNVNDKQRQQPALSNNQPNESQLPQASTRQPESFQPLASVDISSSGTSSFPVVNPTSAVRKRAVSSSVDTDSGIPLLSSHPLTQQPLGSHKHPDQSKQTTLMPYGQRGPTRCHKSWDMPDGERIVVPINNLGQPVGPEACKLGAFLGTIARNGEMAPLTFPDWFSVPDEFKENMWRFVQAKFDIDPLCKFWVLKNLAAKWRNWKATLKANHYYPHSTDEERLKDRNERVLPDQWPILISYWSSEEVQLRSAVNKANRARHMGSHTAGSKSYARIREEERAKRPDGREPTRAELYIKTHTRKDGQPLNETASEIIAKLRKQETQSQQTSHGSSGCDAFSKVVGNKKSGRVLGPSSDDIRVRRPAHSEIIRLALESKNSAKEEVGKAIDKIGTMEQRYALMEAQVARMTSSMQSFFDKIDEPYKPLAKEQVLNNSNARDYSHQRDDHFSSSHTVSSNER